MNKKLLGAGFTLSGTIIGAGILGLPFVFARSGYLSGLFWTLFLGGVFTYLNLALGEVTLRTKGKHQLAGYVEEYLGRAASKLMFLGVIIGVYAALLAYLVGQGESLSRLLPGNIHPLLLGSLFWMIMTLLLREGLKGLKKVETYGVLVIILLVFGIFFRFFPHIKLENLTTLNPSLFALPLGVVLFSFLGFTAIPEVRETLRGNEKSLKKAIIIGSLIPVVLFTLFSATFVGMLGHEVSEIATLSFGPIILILGIFAMLTSYFGLSFVLKDLYRYDFNLSRTNNFLLTSVVPLVLYLFVSFFELAGFTTILGIGGVLSGGIVGVLILLTNRASKRRRGRNSEFKIINNWSIIIAITLLFIIGSILEFMF